MKTQIKIFCLISILFLLTSCLPKQQKFTPLYDAKYAEENEGVKDLLLSRLPKAPTGFKWIMFQGVSLRKPIEWSEYKTSKTYTSSLESVAKNGKFETGITVQKVSNIKKLKGVLATEYGVAYLKVFEADKNNKTLIRTFGGAKEFETVVYRYRNAPKNLKPIIVHKFIIANDNEDSIAIVTLEAPEKNWNEVWKKYGLIIFKQVFAEPFN